jgi:hypothetical protein
VPLQLAEGDDVITPGPWELREGYEEVFGPGIYTPGAHDTEPHAAVSQFAADPEADALLIAAAPDLLAALEHLAALAELPEFRKYGVSKPMIRQLTRAAIAKARGE